MGFILEKIEEAIKELLIGWIESNMTNMFTDVNEKVGTIAAEVGKTPSSWDSSIYQMIRGLSENVIVPIAGIIITFVPVSYTHLDVYKRQIMFSLPLSSSCCPFLSKLYLRSNTRNGTS